MTDAAARLRWSVAGLLVSLALALPARAGVAFGDIDITPPPSTRQLEIRTHGYYEYVFLVSNQSVERPHAVSLRMPSEQYHLRGDYLREVRRTVSVGPGETVRLALFQPDYPPTSGRDVVVFIDNQRQERDLPLVLNEASHSGYRSYRGSRGYGSYSPVVLELLVRANPALAFPKPPSAGGGMGMVGMPMGGSAGFRPLRPPLGRPPIVVPQAPPPMLPPNTHIIAADPVESWSTDWLAYSRYDGIVVTGDDVRAMPPAVRSALWQYAETGGALAILGTAQLPDSWRPVGARPGGFAAYEAGFGECLVHADADIAKWDGERLRTLTDTWVRTAAAWQLTRNTHAANEKFPVVDKLGTPIKGLFVLMFLFTLAIGPVNFIVLARKKRRIWLLWTTPLISLLTCLAVFGYMLISEGWRGHLRTDTVTILDEGAHRATTLGWTAVYSPLTPGDGLHFSYETEVVSQRMGEGQSTGVRACTIDWSRDQHFTSGWVEARVPAHFRVRKSETRRERVAIEREPDGRLSMVNFLRAKIHKFWYAGADKMAYVAMDVAPNARVVLTPLNAEVPPLPAEALRQLYRSDHLPMTAEMMTRSPLRNLRPNSYLAELDDSPFLDGALPDAKTRRCHALVLGLLKRSD